MIKVAISGADTPDAGELIRILINHPDVDLLSISASGHEGLHANAVHRGLIGETDISFSSFPKLERADILFICAPGLTPADIPASAYSDNLKTVSFHPGETICGADINPVFALPEINRKALVRGATSAVLPSPASSLVLCALYPLALNMVLPSDLSIHLYAPDDISAGRALNRSSEEIKSALAEAQKSFCGKVEFTTHPVKENRGMMIETDIPCNVGLEHILELYGIYDDHNFSFVVISPVDVADVVGTDKCIISVTKPDDSTLRIRAVADCRMRGAAGEAVHVMNLLFGLHEKTGLALKTSLFSPKAAPDGLFFG